MSRTLTLRQLLPAMRKIPHILTMTCPGFDESLEVSVTSQGNGDDVDIVSVDDVSVGAVSLLADEIFLKKSAVLCDGSALDFFTLRQWCEAIAGGQECLDQILAERGDAR